jgi:hypothetical protein
VQQVPMATARPVENRVGALRRQAIDNTGC